MDDDNNDDADYDYTTCMILTSKKRKKIFNIAMKYIPDKKISIDIAFPDRNGKMIQFSTKISTEIFRNISHHLGNELFDFYINKNNKVFLRFYRCKYRLFRLHDYKSSYHMIKSFHNPDTDTFQLDNK